MEVRTKVDLFITLQKKQSALRLPTFESLLTKCNSLFQGWKPLAPAAFKTAAHLVA